MSEICNFCFFERVAAMLKWLHKRRGHAMMRKIVYIYFVIFIEVASL